MSMFAPFRPSAGGGARGRRWRHFVRLTTAYYLSSEWKIAWVMLLTVIGTRFGAVYVTGMSNMWFKSLFDAIGDRRADLMMPLVWQMALIMVLTTVYGLIGGYVQAMLSMRWRAWLTADYQERWLRDDRYLSIERADRVDNADQRMTEDIILFTQQFLALALGLLTALSMIWVFGRQLLAVSDSIRFTIAGHAVAIPGDLVIYAVLYAVIGSWLVHKVGRAFVHLTMRQQKLEANYRFRLINVRRNAEQIAFSRAAASEWRMLNGDFMLLFHNFRRTQYANAGIGFVGGIYSGIQELMPIFLVLPKYFAGRVTIGDIMLVRTGFSSFGMALSWFVQSYPTIAIVIASVNRLRALDEAIEARDGGAITVSQNAGALAVRDLRIARPGGEPLVAIGDWQVARGERWCIAGPSGAGKSTLLRAVAGIWPYGSGAVELPGRGSLMFLPQKGYLPIGTIKDAMTFPGTSDAHADEECERLLQRVGLNQWVASLHESARWSERLSPGEQQRLAIARVLLQRPDTLFLDEATSALDPDNADHAFATLLDELPDLTLVSVVHDPALERFHHHKLVIRNGSARRDEPIRFQKDD